MHCVVFLQWISHSSIRETSRRNAYNINTRNMQWIAHSSIRETSRRNAYNINTRNDDDFKAG